jgi:hypothetical protein
MPVAVDDVAGRVRQLLAPPPMAHGPFPIRALVACALMIGAVGVPLYGSVHESIESLVAFGAGHE